MLRRLSVNKFDLLSLFAPSSCVTRLLLARFEREQTDHMTALLPWLGSKSHFAWSQGPSPRSISCANLTPAQLPCPRPSLVPSFPSTTSRPCLSFIQHHIVPATRAGFDPLLRPSHHLLSYSRISKRSFVHDTHPSTAPSRNETETHQLSNRPPPTSTAEIHLARPHETRR